MTKAFRKVCGAVFNLMKERFSGRDRGAIPPNELRSGPSRKEASVVGNLPPAWTTDFGGGGGCPKVVTVGAGLLIL